MVQTVALLHSVAVAEIVVRASHLHLSRQARRQHHKSAPSHYADFVIYNDREDRYR